MVLEGPAATWRESRVMETYSAREARRVSRARRFNSGSTDALRPRQPRFMWAWMKPFVTANSVAWSSDHEHPRARASREMR